MKNLTPLEKEIFDAIVENIFVNPDKVDGVTKTVWQEASIAAAALCEKKIRRAIELARESYIAPFNTNKLRYTREEILELLNQNK